MPCREDRESRRHRFEDRIWNSFLVLVRRRFARVEKTMRAAVKIEQFPLRKKTAEMDFAHDPEFFGELFEMRLKRSLARDDQLRVRKFFLENGKRAQRSRDAFFWNQPARLHETPAAVGGLIAPDERKFVERNAGAIDSQPFRRTTKREQSFGERLRPREHQRHRVEQLFQLRSVIADIFFLVHIGAVKRDDTRLVPALDERQEMHASVPEINVHQVSAAAFE